jgi:hypothetical protein
METVIGRRVELEFSDWRPGDQRYFVADSRRARAELGLKRRGPGAKASRPWPPGCRPSVRRAAHRRGGRLMAPTPLHLFMTTDAVGGVWQYALDLARGLETHDVRTTLAVPGPRAQGDQLAQAARVPACG